MAKKLPTNLQLFAHPNLQTTSLVIKNVNYKSTTWTLEVVDSTMKNSLYLQPTIYDPPL